MKTCPNCGTLLFDDVDKCTKCGLEMGAGNGPGAEVSAPAVSTENENIQTETIETPETLNTSETPEANTSSALAAPTVTESTGTDGNNEPTTTEPTESAAPAPPAPPAPQEPPAAPDTGVTTKPQGVSTGEIVKESAQKRKKWLDEQDKIKAELASIMSRVGKKRQSLMGMPTGYIQMAGQQIEPGASVPFHKSVGVSPQINPQGGQIAIVQPTQAQGQAALQALRSQGGPESGAPGGEGLSEFDKKELMGELDDLRNEGYDVSRLEKIIEEEPGNAWKAFSEFLDDIENINQLRGRLESMNTTGLQAFTERKNEILLKMNNPDILHQIEGEVDNFEKELAAAKAQRQQFAAAPSAAGIDKKAEQLEQYVEAGKNALRQKDYAKALEIFNKSLELDPNNREIQFFKKKLETKLEEMSGAAPAQPVAPTPAPQPAYVQPVQPQLQAQPTAVPQARVGIDDEFLDKKKKKKKKLISRKPGVGVGAPTPASVPTAAQPLQAVPANAGGGDDVEGPKSAAEFEALGFNAYINKDYPKALEFFEKVLEIDPNFPNVDNLKKECLMRLGK